MTRYYAREPAEVLQNTSDRSAAPIIAQAEEVSRHFIYYHAGDVVYKGGPNVHPIFLRKPMTEIMFAHEYDDYDTTYTEQAFSLPKGAPEWMQEADVNMGFWRKISLRNPRKHVALQQYAEYVKELKCHSFEEKDLGGTHSYVMNIARFMLVAMRARQRYGKEVTFDDMIFSHAIFDDFFVVLKTAHVTCSTRLKFSKSLLHMVKFLQEKSDFYVIGNSLRKQALETGFKLLSHRIRLLKEEERFRKSLEGIAYVPRKANSESAFDSPHWNRLLTALRADGVSGKFVCQLDDMNGQLKTSRMYNTV
ncbi:hypothetical protein RB195_010502 [Necator americanus]|uniref:Core-2/I-Branching enzyme n=1 Tax=Necator americanus TaxID=51031 RepID=A0ABR1CZN8_NECAM